MSRSSPPPPYLSLTDEARFGHLYSVDWRRRRRKYESRPQQLSDGGRRRQVALHGDGSIVTERSLAAATMMVRGSGSGGWTGGASATCDSPTYEIE